MRYIEFNLPFSSKLTLLSTAELRKQKTSICLTSMMIDKEINSKLMDHYRVSYILVIEN